MMTSTQKFNCIFCTDCFENKEDLQIHFRKHGDPKFNQNVKSNRRLSESQGSGEKPNDDGEVVSCDVCTEVFPTISKAITHKHKVHPDHDAKYFCPWCGKLFTMKHLYNKHIQSNHDSEEEAEERGFHCDYCDVDFFAPSAMMYHNKFFHRQDTELAAIGQSKKLKMFNQEPLQIYYCPFCGEEYCNKVNLHKHMGDDHIDENQSPDDVMRCPLCDAIFYHLDAYEIHLTFHTSEDIYNEENERVNEVNEYSLETVPPIMEKVEPLDSQEDAEATMNSLGIEEFLQQAMNETGDNEDTTGEQVPEKRKKHKKHKKSKKSAITLDEFLNMNKDVFGEGIDFQGIEEVPSQVVAKQLKKPPPRSKLSPKMPPKQLAKLKKQGIVVKMNSYKNFPNLQGMKVTKNTLNISQKGLPHQMKVVPQAKTNTISTSSDVLSKLLNQNNSQLKIVKKSTRESPSSEIPETSDAKSTSDDKSSDKGECSTQNECEVTNETNKEDIIPAIEDHSKIVISANQSSQHNIQDALLSSPKELNSQIITEEIIPNSINDCTHENQELPPDNPDCSMISINDSTKLAKTNSSKTMNALRNIGQHITIKSVSSPNQLINEPIKLQTETNDDHISDTEDDDHDVAEAKTSKSDIDQDDNNHNKKSLDVLKHLGGLVTVKPVSQPIVTTPTVQKKPTENMTNTQANTENDDDHIFDTENDGDDDVSLATVRKNNTGQDGNNPSKKSLDVLKHLSSLVTVKSVNKPKVISPMVPKKLIENMSNKTPKNLTSSQNEDQTVEDEQTTDEVEHTKLRVESTAVKEKVQEQRETSKSFDALKNLSKHITIKSLNQSMNSKHVDNKCFKNDSNNAEDHDDIEDDVDFEISKNEFKTENTHDNLSNNKSPAMKAVNQLKSPVERNQSPNNSPKPMNRPIQNKIETVNENNSNETFMKKQSCANIMKQLSNVTAKPVNVAQNIHQVASSVVSSPAQSMNITRGNLIQKCVKKEEMKEEIEIFNIDDSDDEEVNIPDLPKKPINSKPVVTNPQITEPKNKSINALKNLSKHITVKSNKQEPLANEITEETFHDDDHESPYEDFDNDMDRKNIKQCVQKPVGQKKTALQHTLKNLSKHITVKSRNTSPNTPAKSQETNYTGKLELNDFDCDSNSSSKKVQITEMDDDDNVSDDEILLKANKTDNGKLTSNVIIQSPHESNSENEEFDDDDIVSSDIESKIKTNKLIKSTPDININKNNLAFKIINKNLTIKTLKEDNSDDEDETERVCDQNRKIPNISNELSIKPYRQMKAVGQIQEECNTTPCNKYNRQVTERLMKQCAANQRQSASSDQQVNTVNKEVSVRTFQSKTVIQEITTTVTKTIRTVNQTVQQEVQSMSHASSMPMMRPQKIQGMRPTLPNRNYQGVAVRQAVPTLGPRVRNAGYPVKSAVNSIIRPSNQIVPARSSNSIVPVRPSNKIVPLRPSNPSVPVRASNQLVSVRPGMNQIRPNQRIPVMKNAPSTCSSQHVVGKPLKIAPSAMISATKRPSEDSSGPFSCFKKQKESLIPVPDLPGFDSNQEGDSLQYASSSHISKSNFTSSIKTMKGNSLVMSHMKSATSTSSEQLSRLNNMSGLNVMKTNQTKQTRFEKNSEVSASKRSALEAIQKLQKQGLLVKKPRPSDEDNQSEYSNSGDEEFDT